jgi:hypothetical protein
MSPNPEERGHLSCSHVGKSVQHRHTNQRRGLPDSEVSPGKDDGGPPGQTGAIPGGYSERVALRREQCNEFSCSASLALGRLLCRLP